MQTVQKKVYSLLTADTQLRTLLGGSGTDSKIYPAISDKFESFPCVVYDVVDGSYRSFPTGSQDMVLQFRIYSKDSAVSRGKQAVEDIFTRINTILNYYKDTDPTVVYIRQSLESDDNEQDRLLFCKVVRYQIWALP